MRSYFQWIHDLEASLEAHKAENGINQAAIMNNGAQPPYVSIEAYTAGDAGQSETIGNHKLNIKLLCFGSGGSNKQVAQRNSMILAIKTLKHLEKYFADEFDFVDFITIAGFVDSSNQVYTDKPDIAVDINVS